MTFRLVPDQKPDEILALAEKHFLKHCPPGIRLESSGDDQKRALTPADAKAAGADFIVVGRPIIEASDPAEAAKKVLKEIG